MDKLLSQTKTVLGKKLVGAYLYGSLVWGNFDHEISDIDLLAATSSDINEEDFNGLKRMQEDLVKEYPRWDNRLEIAYMSVPALKTFKSRKSQIAIVSPGEPFHIKEADKGWLMNWYFVQENSVILYGPSPGTIIEPISKSEFIHALKDHIKTWREYIVHTRHSRPYQAYAILTMCRALYACKNGEQVSKNRAAAWAKNELPEWSYLIQNALDWRIDCRNRQINHEATYPETVKFVNFILDRVWNDR